MNVREAHKILDKLVKEGKGDLEIYSEYLRLEQINERVADAYCDGCQTEMKIGTPFVEIYLDH